MRKSKPIVIHLPSQMVDTLHHYLEVNPPVFNYRIEYFYYVIHHLVTLQIRYKDNNYISLNTSTLKATSVFNIGLYIKVLKKSGVILSDNIFIPGKKSFGFKLNPDCINGVTKVTLSPKSKLHKSIINGQYQKKAHYNRQESHIKLMRAKLMSLELDYDAAYQWVENNASDEQKLYYSSSVEQIKDKRFRYIDRNRTNRRLDTNITNLKSDLRQFFIGEYVSIDLKNSQPFLLAILIDGIINNRGYICSYLQYSSLVKTFGKRRIQEVLKFHQNQKKVKMVNFRKYFKSTLNGVLYDEFVESFPENVSREEVKSMMFKVLFSSNRSNKGKLPGIPYDSEKRAFATVHPFVYEVVRLLKVKDHKLLPIYLQRLESYLFIDCIAKELVENGIVPITIHDSVIIELKDQQRALLIMGRIFKQQFGVVPSFEIMRLKE